MIRLAHFELVHQCMSSMAESFADNGAVFSQYVKSTIAVCRASVKAEDERYREGTMQHTGVRRPCHTVS